MGSPYYVTYKPCVPSVARSLWSHPYKGHNKYSSINYAAISVTALFFNCLSTKLG